MSAPAGLTVNLTPAISSRSSRSTLSRRDDCLNVPAAAGASRQTPLLLDDNRLTAFPFPPQRSPLRSPTIIDDLVQYRETHSPFPRPILGRRSSRSIAEPPRIRNRRAATVLSLIEELAFIGNAEEDDYTGDDLRRKARASNPPEERYKGKEASHDFRDPRQILSLLFQAYHDDDQKAGVESFQEFESRMEALDHQLLAFHNAVRHLGSSVGLFVCAVALRERFKEVLHSFRNYSSIAFPALRQSVEEPSPNLPSISDQGEGGSTTQELKSISSTLEMLARDLEKFLDRINQISEFAEEGVNACVKAFVADIQFWASSLEEFHDKLHSKELSKYIHDLTEPLGTHILIFSGALISFIDVGVPTIRLAQQQAGKAFLNLSTVSTLLSGVTATTIQFTYADAKSALQQSINLLWILSLVFSIASAINAQLAYYWSSTKFRSPRSQVPWWGFMVITQAPLYFLVGSVIAFSAGLVCFTFSAFPHTLIPTVITMCTAVTLTSLVAVLFWLAGERWAFVHSRGSRWFISFVYPAKRGSTWRVPITLLVWARRMQTWAMHVLSRIQRPRTHADIVARDIAADLEARPRTMKESKRSREDDIASQPPLVSPTAASSLGKPPIPSIEIKTASDLESPYIAPRRNLPITEAASVLSRLEPLEPVHKHVSPILHIAFSPDGKSLASCGWDTHVLLWKCDGGSMSVYKTLIHPPGAVRQVCWSPDGRTLLGRMRRTIVFWDTNSIDPSAQTIERGVDIRSLIWMPSGRSILAVEGSQLTHMSVRGSIVTSHTLPRLVMDDAAITKDGSRVVAVATLELTTSGLSPSKLTPEKRLLVYNLNTRLIEDQIPILQSAKHVTLSNNDNTMLVTFERKPPQLIRLAISPVTLTRHLVALHSCHYPGGVEAVGSGSIGALCATTEDDQLIVCSGKDEVRLWERTTGRLFGATPPTDDDVELTCSAWNHGAMGSLLLAAGANDGSLRFWKAPVP